MAALYLFISASDSGLNIESAAFGLLELNVLLVELLALFCPQLASTKQRSI